MFRFIGQYFRRRQRKIDRMILFPQLGVITEGDESKQCRAAIAILMHIKIDSAWRFPCEWKDEEPQLYRLAIAFGTCQQH